MKYLAKLSACLYIFLPPACLFAVACNEGGNSYIGPTLRHLIYHRPDSSLKKKPATPPAVAEAKHIATDTASFDRTCNDIARYIAGMKQEPGSKLIPLEKDTVWIKFSKNFDKEWQQLNKNRLAKMNSWAATELASQRKANLNLFYPFSGPDILHAADFFPDPKRYSMFALERAGSLPDMQKMKPSAIETYLNSIYASLSDVFTKSYFITHNMLTDLQRENVNGATPLISVFLVRTNHTIVNLKYFHLNNDGSETPVKKDSAIHFNDFVKVYFRKKGDSALQVVSYLKCDLSDEGIASNKALASMLNNLPQVTTYLKSASYLLHYKNFNTLRNIILNKSATILEDDTGIPYKYLAKDKWTISLYGQYVTPVSNFSGVFQDDLKQAYGDTLGHKVKSLPFSLGYHWGTNYQNLIKAERK